MKTLIASLALAVSSAFAGVPVTNELLTVNEKNEVSVPGVLGTVSDVARLQAATEIAAAQAATAAQVYEDTTNLLNDVARQLVNRNAVVYRKYFLDAFTAALIIDPSKDKDDIYGFTVAPSSEQTVPGSQVCYCYYGCTADILNLRGIFKSNSDLTVSREEWLYLDASMVLDVSVDPDKDPYVDEDGNRFEHCYRAKLAIPNGIMGFMIINIEGQAADSDGATLLLYGGVKDGVTGTIHDGQLAYELVGGLCVGVIPGN